jgi:hypothetical protein
VIRFRNYSPLLLLVITLMCLTSSDYDCKHEVVVDGISKRPMAQATVDRFLRSLKTGEFETAARCFAGPFEVLHAVALGPVNTDDPSAATPPRLPDSYRPTLEETADWLEKYVSKHPTCVYDYQVGAEKMIEPHTFTVEVEFRVWGQEPICELFQIGYDGNKYWVLGLPPIFKES